MVLYREPLAVGAMAVSLAPTGGANFALADASVRFVADSIAVIPYAASSTRSGGEVVGISN